VPRETNPDIGAAEKRLSEIIGTKVLIKPKQIIIEYYNQEDLERIYNIFNK